MNSSIDNSINSGGNQNITGLKTFNRALGFVIKNPDITIASTTEEGVMQFQAHDVNGVNMGMFSVYKDGAGRNRTGFFVRDHANSKWSNFSIGFDSSDNFISYVDTPVDNANTGNNQVVNTGWARNRSGFAGSADRTAISWTLNSSYTMPADGLLVVTVNVSGQPESIVTLLMGTNGSGSVISRAAHYGGGTESNKVPLVFLVRKNQSFYLNWNGSGSASVDSAYLWKYPSQGV